MYLVLRVVVGYSNDHAMLLCNLFSIACCFTCDMSGIVSFMMLCYYVFSIACCCTCAMTGIVSFMMLCYYLFSIACCCRI